VEYHITQYDLEQGALEIQYIEEFFGEFPRKKTATEIVRRLAGRQHLILLANAPLIDEPASIALRGREIRAERFRQRRVEGVLDQETAARSPRLPPKRENGGADRDLKSSATA
jgi:hypothetical protein